METWDAYVPGTKGAQTGLASIPIKLILFAVLSDWEKSRY
jgi:hypothetical protein